MKKTLITVFLLFVGMAAFAQTDDSMYNAARLLIHGEDPVAAAARLADEQLTRFLRYGLGTREFESFRQLGNDDSWLLAFLLNNESSRRRTANRDEFFLFLHEQEESVSAMPLNSAAGTALGWLMVMDMAVRVGNLPVGRQ